MKPGKSLILVLLLFAIGTQLFGQSKDPYKVFNDYRAMAESAKAYPGAPLKGKIIGFANINGTFPFCVAVENNIKEHLRRAGLDLGKGWISMDNMGDPRTGLKNAELMLARKPNFFIEFQIDPLVNNVVAAKFGAAKIPLLAIDVPIPGSPFMGCDNYKVALLCGHLMARLIREKWSGWDGVDMVVLGQVPEIGDVALLRSEGVAYALAEEFEIRPDDPKIVRFNFVNDAPEEGGWGFAEVLAAHPDAVKIAAAAINEIYMAGIIAAMQNAGRWDPANKVIVTMGADEIGRSQLREGLSDAAIAFFPERYGEYVVPAVCAILTGNPVPPYIFVENEVITKANIDQWYPKKK
jgi:ribose transport system substrate-binding protein